MSRGRDANYAIRMPANENLEELQNCGVVNFRRAFDARNGIAFEHEPENHFGLLDGQVHAV
jgi:hypothetical protein